MSSEVKEYVIGSIKDIPSGTHKVLEVGKRKIGVFNIEGKYYALPNLCPHQLGPLCSGKVSGTLIANDDTDWKMQWDQEGEIVTCPWHGLEFHVPSGQCLAFSEIRLRSYNLWVEDGLIKIRF